MKALLNYCAALIVGLTVGLTAAQAKGKNDPETEQAIQKLERQWAEALVTADTAAIEKIEADHFVFGYPGGKVTGKADDIRDLKTGDFKCQEIKFDEIKVRVYGKTAIATGLATMKATYKKEDISGKYRFTDVFVRKKDNWQAVSSQLTPLAPPKK